MARLTEIIKDLFKNPKNRPYLGIFVLLIIVGVVFTSSFYISRQNANHNLSDKIKVLGAVVNDPSRPPYIERSEIYGRMGKITQIGDNYLVIDSFYTLNYQKVQATLTVSADSSTVIIKRDAKALLKTGPHATADTAAEKISLKDLAVGQIISVDSAENIYNKTEFSATKIEYRY